MFVHACRLVTAGIPAFSRVIAVLKLDISPAHNVVIDLRIFAVFRLSFHNSNATDLTLHIFRAVVTFFIDMRFPDGTAADFTLAEM